MIVTFVIKGNVLPDLTLSSYLYLSHSSGIWMALLLLIRVRPLADVSCGAKCWLQT